MSTQKKEFLKASQKISFDPEHRKIVNFNMSKYYDAFDAGKTNNYKNLSTLKDKASIWKSKIINNLDTYLLQFEENATRNGIKVCWAENSRQANEIIAKIAKEKNARLIVKSKSMTSEEIGMNESLEKNNLEVVETDLGEYIVQIAGEKPYHIVTPAMHKSKENIAELFHEKFNTPENETPENLTQFVRNKIRQKFVSADIGITGANFVIADTGSIAVTENEGNAILSTSFPDTHIVLVGMEKLLPSIKNIAQSWQLLAQHGTGQQITVYNSIFSAPRKGKEMIVILLDNKRTELLANEQRESLKCIRCGACLNYCPIYKTVGGYTYNSVYSGPIGSVITPFYKGFDAYGHLSHASTLCGRCTEVCPVKIPLHKLLLKNRQQKEPSKFVKINNKILYNVLKNKKLQNLLSYQIKNRLMRMAYLLMFNKRVKFVKLTSNSFSSKNKKNDKLLEN